MTAAAIEVIIPAAPRQGPWRRAVRRLFRQRTASFGLCVVAAMVLLAIFAPWLAPYDPLATSFALVRKAPGGAHWFGTDEVGRDLLSRVVWGGRASLAAGVISVSIAIGLGVPVGMDILGKPWSEGRLIELAYSFGQEVHVRKPPNSAPALLRQ